MLDNYSNSAVLHVRHDNRVKWIDRICSLLLVVSPILQHYQGLVKNAGFTVLVLLFPFIMLKMLSIFRQRNILTLAIVPLLLFEFYSAIHIDAFSIESLVYSVYISVLFFCIAIDGCIDRELCIKYALLISKIASILILIQTASYYLLDYYVRCVPVNLLLPNSDMWLTRMIYGVSSAGAMFRPSAIFLEPSHFVLYTFPHVCICLLSSKRDIKSAVLVSLGIGCSTSGMGICCLLLLWSVYCFFYIDKGRTKHVLYKLFSIRTIIVALFILVVIVCLYLFVPVFRGTVDRIFYSSVGHSSAIDGRIRLANRLVKGLDGKNLFFGVAKIDESIDFNMAGFHATLYRWGIVGVVLSYWFYVQGLFRLKNAYFWMTVIVLILSFFSAHTHGTFYLIYYVIFLINGYFKRHISDEVFN